MTKETLIEVITALQEGRPVQYKRLGPDHKWQDYDRHLVHLDLSDYDFRVKPYLAFRDEFELREAININGTYMICRGVHSPIVFKKDEAAKWPYEMYIYDFSTSKWISSGEALDECKFENGHTFGKYLGE